eukprot:scaffold7392_cov286-Pinguiococcus_pyrenoidosus.AAC.18
MESEVRVKEETERLQGVYCCREADNFAICTHLEPAFCRNVIPCCDAPHLKAVFKTTVSFKPLVRPFLRWCPLTTRSLRQVVAPVNSLVVSVTPLKAREPAPRVETDTFRTLGPSESYVFEETAVRIPTYIWGFWAYARAEIVEHGSVLGTPVRTVFMTPQSPQESGDGGSANVKRMTEEKTAECTYAAMWGAFALRFFSEKFRLMPPLQKLDFLPLPGLNGAQHCLHCASRPMELTAPPPH